MNQAFACERILVPTDLSAFATRAVEYAHGLAEKRHAELRVLHVVRVGSGQEVSHFRGQE